MAHVEIIDIQTSLAFDKLSMAKTGSFQSSGHAIAYYSSKSSQVFERCGGIIIPS